MEPGDVFHYWDGIPCPAHGHVIGPEPQHFVSYFVSGQTECPGCGDKLDWWKRALELITELPAHWSAFGLLGAYKSSTRILLEADKTAVLNLDELDIPPEAEILSLHYSALLPSEQQGPFPMEMRREYRRGPIQRQIVLYGATHGRRLPLPSTIMVSITWIAPDESEVSIHSLADAAVQYAAGRYSSLVVPANVAVEIAVGRAVSRAVDGFCSPDDRRDFMRASYASKLKVVFPLLAHMVGAPRLPDHILSCLNDLRGLRNDMGHAGKPKRTLSQQGTAQLLNAAIFGYHYARFLDGKIDDAQRNGTLPNRPTGQKS